MQQSPDFGLRMTLQEGQR